ncbi:arylsulfatase, partial [Nocardia sp. NPDC005998]
HYLYNFLGIQPEQDFVSAPLTPGKHTLGMEFNRETSGQHGESIGTTTLYIDGQPVSKGPMRAQPARFGLAGEGLSIGYDSGDTISPQYQSPATFTGGTIHNVTIDIGKQSFNDLQKEAAAVLEGN